MTPYPGKTGNLLWTFVILCLLLFVNCESKPPNEKGDFRNPDLIELISLDPAFKLDIRYATTNNCAGKPVYKQGRAFLQRPAAEALVRVNNEFKLLGYRLLIFDGYRPWSVTKIFWDITSEENKKFVADPKVGSKHNRGCAVDLSLYEVASGKEVSMPGEYDETSERSYPGYTGGTDEQRRMRDLLRSKMEANGFSVYDCEWWHFDFKEWKLYRIQNVSFEEIK